MSMAANRACGISTYVVEDNKRLCPATLMVADRMEDASSNNSGQQLLDEERQEGRRDGGQVEVVDQEQRLELEGLAVAHELTTTEDDGVVDSNEYPRLPQGGHGRAARDELKLADRVASKESPDLVEYRP